MLTPKEMLLRRGNHERAIELLKQAIRSDALDARYCPPPRNLRRAHTQDIWPGQIVWTGARNKAFVKQWQIVEHPHEDDPRGPGFVSQGTIYRIKNCWVEK